MAKATFNPAKTETKVIQVAPASVTLELSPDEAAALLAVTGRMYHNGPTSDVYSALEDVLSSQTGLPDYDVQIKDGSAYDAGWKRSPTLRVIEY